MSVEATIKHCLIVQMPKPVAANPATTAGVLYPHSVVKESVTTGRCDNWQGRFAYAA
jgi:hypothetical protein